ncbi:MAG: hypothetical protein P4N41_07375 [Negativicutes bacterium]|nr:hypothetical protein [Negativicutes bacterium]
MEFSFNLFQPRKYRARPRVTEPIVEVKPSGRVFFNKQACELLENKQFCLMGYDSAHKAVGILPTAQSDRNAVAVRYTAKGAYLGAKKFLSHFNLLPQSSIQSPPQKNGEFIAIKW